MELSRKKILEVAERYLDLEQELDALRKEIDLLQAEHELLRDILFIGYPQKETSQIIDMLKEADADKFVSLIEEIRLEMAHRDELFEQGTNLDEALLQKKQGCIICGRYRDASFTELADKGMTLRDEQGGGWICMDCFLASDLDEEDEGEDDQA
jgi:hypothetical protein